ncbi:germin-like protein subfamily 1 member 16 [Impatiens glandulifera]|uniref:germin-like protein subfamily 1 member 16 n=1 Tax=Impatiens glandulifera TaxID=253017 RepID=UPI001FB0B216|nr:germin-like protein subfamily 1 member 16 [Impatiens glandulifera]
MGKQLLVPISILALAYSLIIVNASDPSPLQDFCVATDDPKDAAVFVNGCKNPNLVNADDFFFTGLNKPGNTFNPLGSEVTAVSVIKLKGLNTLGISLARIDFAPYGLNPPHIHPRGTEVLLVLEGSLLVGFVTSNIPNQKNRLFTKTLYAGDVFVFPEGLVHFQQNIAETNTIAFAGLSNQNPGTITIANAVFGSDPKISPHVLTKAFQVDKDVTDYLQSQFWWDNNY